MRAFVTVGSTKFDDLIQRVFFDEVLDALRQEGYTELTVQCGNSAFEHAALVASGEEYRAERLGMAIRSWKFKPTLEEEYEKADLVISHAGSGTILDVLRRGKKLIAVPNETLLDNHQLELAEALQEKGHLLSATPGDLVQAIHDIHKVRIVPFPQYDGSRFAELLDETVGFL